MSSDNITLERLDSQIEWHEDKAAYNQRRFKALKAAGIVVATAIPVLSAMPERIPNWALGAMGALVAALEAFQQLYQYHANWMTYRSTCEALQRERFLYLAHAGEYAAAPGPAALLAERVETLIAQETVAWAAVHRNQQAKSGAVTAEEGDSPAKETS